MIKLKISFRFIVTIVSIIVAILLGLTRISDPEFVQVLRLKYFDQLQIKYPRVTEGQTYSVIVDIDEKSLREIGQWPWPRTVLADLFNKSREAGMLVLGLDVLFAEKDRTSPELIAEDVKERSPEIANLLKTLPSNESLAMEAMKAFPTVIGHSGLDVQGDANRNDIKDTSVKVFLGKNKKPKDWLIKYPGLLANVTEFEKAASGAGTVSVAEEPDGIIRRVPLISNVAGIVRPTLGLDMIRVAFKGNSIATRTGLNGVEEIIIQTKAIGNASIPTDENGRVWIYYGESDSIKKENSRRYYVSAVDIINGKVGKDRLSGKLGILGTSATGLKDIRPTPVEDRMPGVEIHANLIDTVISAILYYTSNKNANAVYNQSIKKGMSESEALAEKNKVKINGAPFLKSGANMKFYESLFTILLGFFITLSALRFGPIVNISLLVSIIGAAFYLSIKLFLEEKTLFDPTFAGVSTFIIYFGNTFANYLRDANEKKQIRGAFSQYLSPALVEQLADDPDKLVLGGETKKMTFLFCDVRGFTTISESFKSDPQGLTKLINRFLTPLTNEIINVNGTIDKYMGDCIMAFWNAPIDVEGHEKMACDATLRMHKAMKELNDIREEEAKAENKKFLELKIGIGLNTGGCVVGNMGSDQRFDYSVLGDAVNLASRLEGQSKSYGVKTVIGPETNESVKDTYATLQLDMIAVKGKKEAVTIFTLLGDSIFKQSSEFKNLESKHKKILENYFNQKWEECLKEIKTAKTLCNNLMSEYYDIMTLRINEFKENPLPNDWDGVYIATSK
ncbi:MAG: adenylate/guanylate cyclase domain-containing protein [Alphaproteobacteria bacterium]